MFAKIQDEFGMCKDSLYLCSLYQGLTTKLHD